jgi:streptomycin 6-kinase
VRIPGLLTEQWRHETEWLHALPRLVAECAEQWQLELEDAIETPHSLVVPAGEAVLKLNAPSHFEADHEAEALARWEGAGAVRLLARNDARRALLCERCRPGTPLWESPRTETTVVLDLLSRLRHDVETPHPFRLLADEAERWAVEVPARYDAAGRPFERALLDFAVAVFRSADPRERRLVNQDLHGGNVLRAQREPWLVVDPKPLVGELELDGVGLLRNARTGAAVRRWLDALSTVNLDRERCRGWGVAHALAWGWDVEQGWSAQAIESARLILSA